MRQSRGSRLAACALYAALTIPFGIAVHLCAEAIALGPGLHILAFFMRHLYLMIFECGSAIIAWRSLCTRSMDEARIEIRLAFRALPAIRNTRHFFLSSVAFQLGFFLATLWLEGSPLTGDDFLVGCGVATLAACFGSALLALLPEDFFDFLISQYFRRIADSVKSLRFRGTDRPTTWSTEFASGYQTVTGGRPPPIRQS